MIDWLESDEGVSRQLQFYLFVLRVYLPTKRHYERQYLAKDHESFKFPSYPLLFRLYNVVSASVFGWIIIKYLWPSVAIWVARVTYHGVFYAWDQLDTRAEPECFSFGRFVFHDEITDESFGFIFALYHMLWRTAQTVLDRHLSLDLVLFLLQPRGEIERFISKLEATNELTERACRWQRRISLPQGDKSTGAAPPLGLSYANLNAKEQLLCDIMCYKVSFVDEFNEQFGVIFKTPPRALYKLRPNRTLEARQRLVHSLASMTINATLAFCAIFSSFSMYILFVVLFNQKRHYRDFASCDPEFSRLYETGQINHWSLPRLTSHRLAVFVGDFVENIFIWTESGSVLVYGLMFACFLNGDLLLCWNHLQQKVRHFSMEFKKIHYYLGYFGDVFSMGRISRLFHEETYGLQAQLSDFYRQIQQVDMLVSDIISYGLIVWLSGSCIVNFKFAALWSATRHGEDAIIFITTWLVTLVGCSIASITLLSLQTRCRSSYLDICTMMAFDRSKYKRNFIGLIRFYTDKNRVSYTWFHQVPFSSGNLVSVLGWSFTGFVIIDSVYNRSR